MLLTLATLQACSDSSLLQRDYSPDKSRHVEIRQNSKTGLQKLILQPGQTVLADAVPSLCGVSLIWGEQSTLTLRLPEPMQSLLRVQTADYARDRIAVELHEDGIIRNVPSPGGNFRVIVAKDCQSGAWGLYLRLAAQPNYDERMLQGWSDPSLLGHFDRRSILKSLSWQGGSRLQVEIQGHRSGATLRESAMGVDIRWTFKAASAPR